MVTNNMVREIPTVSVMSRAASKMVPNRRSFGDSFDRPGYSEAFFQNKQSPSLERGRAGRLRSYESAVCSQAKGAFLQASAFTPPSLAAATPRQDVCKTPMYPQQPIFRFSALKSFQKISVNLRKPVPGLSRTRVSSFSSTPVENPLQIDHILCKTNPISTKVPMNIRAAITKTYANKQRTMNYERPCKTNPIKPNVKIGKMNATLLTTKPYTNEQRTITQNKPKQSQSQYLRSPCCSTKPCPPAEVSIFPFFCRKSPVVMHYMVTAPILEDLRCTNA
jgi:hypothetical protein